MTSDLREVAAEAGRPAALGAGSHAAHVLFTQDLIASLWVGAPRQVGAALHVASEQGVLILRRMIRRMMLVKYLPLMFQHRLHLQPVQTTSNTGSGAGVTLTMVSLSVRMLRKNWEVGCDWQSVIGQLQFITRFCSIRAVRYSCQHDCSTNTHSQTQTSLAHIKHQLPWRPSHPAAVMHAAQ